MSSSIILLQNLAIVWSDQVPNKVQPPAKNSYFSFQAHDESWPANDPSGLLSPWLKSELNMIRLESINNLL